MSEHDFDALGDIQAAIEAAGGDVKDFEAKEVQNGGLAAMLSGVMGGSAPTHHHYLLEVCVSGPTTRDIPDPDGALGAEDAMTAIAVAQSWAEDSDLDALAEDLDRIGSRIGGQVTGQAHPTDEQGDGKLNQDDREPVRFDFTHPDTDDEASVTVPLHPEDLDDRVMYQTTGAASINVNTADGVMGDD